MVDYRYRHLSSSVWVREKETLIQAVPPQEFEVDLENTLAYNGNAEENGFKVIVLSILFFLKCLFLYKNRKNIIRSCLCHMTQVFWIIIVLSSVDKASMKRKRQYFTDTLNPYIIYIPYFIPN